MRRKRRATERMSFRWDDETAGLVRSCAKLTGWSEGRAAALLVRAGWRAYVAKSPAVSDESRLIEAARVMAEARSRAADVVAAARVKLRGQRFAPGKGRNARAAAAAVGGGIATL